MLVRGESFFFGAKIKPRVKIDEERVVGVRNKIFFARKGILATYVNSTQGVVFKTRENIAAKTSLRVRRAYISTIPLTCGRIGGTMGLISGGGP